MICIGLTGGIGSGKSTVAELFKELGIDVIDADQIAHKLTKPDTDPFQAIVEHFGKKVINDEGMLRRDRLRNIIFSDPKERKWLENLLHPIILNTMKKSAAQAQSPYSLLVIPLLTEASDKIDFIDRNCVIVVPPEIQMKRVMKRDRITELEVKAILATQCSNRERLRMADDVIYNEDNLATLQQQVLKLHQKYLILVDHPPSR